MDKGEKHHSFHQSYKGALVSRLRILFALMSIIVAGSAVAQTEDSSEEPATPPATTAADEGPFAKQPCPTPKILHLRPTNQCGVNVFEPPKEEPVQIPQPGTHRPDGFVACPAPLHTSWNALCLKLPAMH